MNALHTLAGLALATLAGFAFAFLDVPLAYILGAMAGSAVYANLFAPIRRARDIRRFGQLVVGTAVAALLTPEVVADLGRLFPLMLLLAVALNAVGAALAIPVARIARVDRLTALLACLPAGMAEMATLARDLKAQEHVVALVHTLRVILVVTLLPLLIGLAAPESPPLPASTVSPQDAAILAGVFVGGAAVSRLAARLGLLNPWVIAPMLLGLAIVAFGGSVPALPQWLIVAAQLAIGASLGARFRVEQLKALPRASIAGVFSTLVLIAVAPIGLAKLTESMTPFGYATLALSMAPGGLGEMIASAKALGVASATVAGFQFTRAAITNLVVPLLIRRWIGARRPTKG
ncbi:MAG TPA: AbrB family transcriptional regulator [Alphaproteobacteria bacterium]|nr:AbrB family transcriptional regulator [Alphaproteobacteria bacterium]